VGGITNNFILGNWSLNLFFQYSLGNKVLNFNRVEFESTGSYTRFSNQYATYNNHWSPENTNTDIPRLIESTARGDAENTNFPKVSSRLVEDASYLRFKTISLSYKFPTTLMKKIGINSLLLAASAQNIWVWTRYTGQDPEVSMYSIGSAAQGLGYSAVSNSNTYSSMAGGYDQAHYPKVLVLNLSANIIF
jgi:hypothetical protein